MSEKCKLCGSDKVYIDYNGIIRDGAVTRKTKHKVKIYKCATCGVMYHEPLKNYEKYYQSETYRKELEGSSELSDFYKIHDFENFDKFSYTGMEIFRDKIVADIGCGGGGFLDFLIGVAKEIIAIEPSYKYREDMKKRKGGGVGFYTYSYASQAFQDYEENIDTIVSFDVIEHVLNPIEFMNDIYRLLKPKGKAIIGTPTDAPVMRSLLGQVYEENLLFSTQHLWILNNTSLQYISEQVGFTNYEIKFKQRYGIGNMISWLIHQKAMGNKKYNFISETMDSVWKHELEAKKLSDYILLFVTK